MKTKITRIRCKVKFCSYNYEGFCERSEIELFVNEEGIVICDSSDYVIAKKVLEDNKLKVIL